jgi:hypothetical protein
MRIVEEHGWWAVYDWDDTWLGCFIARKDAEEYLRAALRARRRNRNQPIDSRPDEHDSMHEVAPGG